MHAAMTSHRVRHLPVLEKPEAPGDRVPRRSGELDHLGSGQEIDQLRTFITGQYPG